VQRLALAPLAAPELDALVNSMPESSGLSDGQRAELIARSDGVPLFVEELIRTADAVERGRVLHRSIHHADYAIPPVLRDPLLSRLAMPGVDLALAQMAATIGRDVDRGLLRQVCGLDDEGFERRLETLFSAGLLDPSGDTAVRFRHELIREVAYETQRRAARRDRHSVIADALLRSDATSQRGDAGEAGFHLERAQRHEEAIDAYVQAAEAAQAVGAHTEATTRLTRALGVVTRLDTGSARDSAELKVRQLRSFSAVMAGGFSAPESIEDHARCVALCTELGSGPELVPSLLLGWTYYCSQGDLARADQVSDSLEQVLSPGGLEGPARGICKGVTRFFQGRFEEARALLEAFLVAPWTNPPGRPPIEWPMPNDPFVSVSSHLLATLWIMGSPKAALAVAEPALRRAAELPFPFGPFSSGYVHSQLVLVHRLQGDDAAARAHVDHMLALGERHGFDMWALVGTIHDLLLRVHDGQFEALDAAVAGVRAWREQLASEAWSPYLLTMLAEAQAQAGRRGAAIEALGEALAVAARTGSEFFDAETLRLRGTLRWESGDPGGLDDLRHAVEKARRQHASAFQLRASVALEAAGSLVSP
jgi:tetratricopeptide (TPR) repeat protein